jgi:ubiquinone/menaquinone biosynthesis C-methylase UbiE
MSTNISDYSDYDYKKHFWEDIDRKYENLCEQQTLRRLIQKIPTKLNIILDAGCGFGRMFPAYQPYGNYFFLLDYALNMLEEVHRLSTHNKNIMPINADIYNIPITDKTIDLTVSIRTLHHIANIDAFFQEINRISKINSHFIFEIPNKRHFLNLCRYLFGKSKLNPFTKEPHKIGDAYYNYHPDYVIKYLKKNNFEVQYTTNLSFFRSNYLKTHFSPELLCKADYVFQKMFSFLNLAPSIYILCKKTVDN